VFSGISGICLALGPPGQTTEHYNRKRVHESLDNLTPEDVYRGRGREIRTARKRLKEQTLRRRRRLNRGLSIKTEDRILPSLYRECVS
jgi:hypothetical protein